MQVPVVDPLSRILIERKAQGLLAAYQPECLSSPTPLNVELLFEKILHDHGFEYDLLPLPSGMEGLTNPKEKVVIIRPDVYDLMCQGDGRSRFTVMHEVGHVVLHAEKVREVMVNCGRAGLARRGEFPYCRDPEWQANELAASLLMPEPSVRKIMNTELGCAGAVAVEFSVSLLAADIRLRNLRIGR